MINEITSSMIASRPRNFSFKAVLTCSSFCFLCMSSVCKNFVSIFFNLLPSSQYEDEILLQRSPKWSGSSSPDQCPCKRAVLLQGFLRSVLPFHFEESF